MRIPPLAFAFYGALATVNADTWATELGVLARSRPRLMTNGQTVPVGTSGGVTAEGTLAALAGALFIGVGRFRADPGRGPADDGRLAAERLDRDPGRRGQRAGRRDGR